MSENPGPLNCAEIPWIGAGLVSLQIELSRHAGHRVNLAAELGDEEAVHDARRGQPEVNRHARRNDEIVDRGDALVRIDEQPAPIQRHHFDLERGSGGFQRLRRIELM